MDQPVYIFDVDGVLNDFVIYDPDPRILAQMVRLVEGGAFVAINTGRGYKWIEQTVVTGLRQRFHDPKDLDKVFVSAEMGGLAVEFTGGVENKVPSAFSIAKKQIQQVKQIFEQHPKYAATMGWYGKESMATLDRLGTADLAAFTLDRDEFAEILKAAFKDQHIKVGISTDAVDVCAPEAGKWAGAQLIYDWLRRVTDTKHDHFVCFGDSPADYEMARFFAAQSHGAEFIFTGGSLEGASLDERVAVTKTHQLYSHGAHEYLQSILVK